MINLGQIATHINRYMNEENMSREEAEKKALKTLNIQELTSEQREELDKLIEAHQEAKQEDQEQAEEQAETIQEETADDAPAEE